MAEPAASRHNARMAMRDPEPAQAGRGPVVRTDVYVCHECDAVHRRPRLARDDIARCRRCGAVLARGPGLTLDGHLALALASAVVFAIASASPIVTLELQGVESVASLWDATRLTWEAGEQLVATLAFCTAFLFPLAVILLRLWVLVPLVAGRRTSPVAWPLRALSFAMRWSMIEVFMLGILIAVVRSAGVTDVVLGAGLFGYAALTVLLTGLQAAGLQAMWQRVELRTHAETAP